MPQGSALGLREPVVELELEDANSRFGWKAGDRGVRHLHPEQQQQILSSSLQLEGPQGLSGPTFCSEHRHR